MKTPNKPAISIITAAYNIEDYLPACLDSILAQTFSDFELILINDGSTDATGMVCDEYAAKDKRIKVFHQSNVGVSDTWNRGIELVQGEFVGFVDGDDIIHPQMYELLYRAVSETSSDIAYCNYQLFSGASGKATFDERTDFAVYMSSREDELEKIAASNSGSTEVIWKGLYRYECIKDLRFLSGKTWQDWMWSPCAILHADRIVRVDRTLYSWRQRPGSNSHEDAIKHYTNGLFVGAQLLEYLQKYYPEWFPLFALRAYTNALTLKGWLMEAGDSEEHAAAEESIDTVLKYFSKLSIKDILSEPRTMLSRKLSALFGKVSFPLASSLKVQVMNYLNRR